MSAMRRAINSHRLLVMAIALPVAGLLAVLAFFLAGAFQGAPGPVQAGHEGGTGAQHSTMDMRLNQLIQALSNPRTAPMAVDSAMEILYGGLRPLPSKDPQTGGPDEQSLEAHKQIALAEMRLAAALEKAAMEIQDPATAQRALDMKFFIEQMNEVAEALAPITSKCGEGDEVTRPPCDQLMPLLDEAKGEEVGVLQNSGVPSTHLPTLHRSYSVKLRAPIVPPWIFTPQEDIRVTDPLAPGECAVVFKEFMGLMLRLHLDRIIIILDPWVPFFGNARGVAFPIWRLEWVPSEYVKTFNICNVNGQTITRPQQLVKQDHPLNFFWRYYRKDP